LVGVQCKGKDGRYGEAVTARELNEEVEKAKKFRPKLKEFIFATTAQNDAKIQETARKITEKHKKEGLFRVEATGWSEIHRRLADYPDLIDKYYPNQGPALHRVEEKVDVLLKQQFIKEERHDRLIFDVANATSEKTVSNIEKLLTSAGLLTDPKHEIPSLSEEFVSAEIDGYRDLLLENKPRTALGLLKQLKERYWDKATHWLKFRILTNIASAHLSLGEKRAASKLFLEAEQYAPQSEKASCNTALAYLIVGDNAKAKNAVLKAIDAHPGSARAYSLLVATSIVDKSIKKPEDLVPAKLLKVGEVAYAISHFYLKRKRGDEATKWISKAYTLDKKHIEIRSSYAAMLLESVTKEQSATVGEQRNEAQEEAIQTAEKVFQGIWDEVKNTETAPQYLQTAINLIYADRLLRKYEAALRVANDALRLVPDSFAIKHQKAIILLEKGDPQEACKVIATLPEKEKLKIALLYAEVLDQIGRAKDALALMDRYLLTKASYKELSVAAGLRLRLLLKTNGKKTAVDSISEAISNYPNAIVVRVNAATVFQECGDTNAALAQFHAAKELIGSKTEYKEKLLVADVAYHLADYEEASTLYKRLVQYYGNSQPLRRLLICLYECDQRKETLELLKKIPPAVRKMSFFRRMTAAIYVRIGDLNAARSEIEAYLALEPDDLHMRLNWISILVRQGEQQAVEKYLADLTDLPEAPPEDRMHLAHLFDHFGHLKKALELAYRVCLENPYNSRVHLGYIGLFTMGNAAAILQEPDRVGVGTSFLVEDKRSRHYSYFILEHETNNPKEGEINPDHPVALSAIGKKVGDTIKIEQNPYQIEERRIIEIKSKYVQLLHITTSGFSDKFPANQDFMLVSVANPEGDGYCFDPIFKSLSDRQDQASEIMAMYNSQPYPIGVLSKLLGTHPIDVWRGIFADRSVQIYCCDGTAHERRKAIALISEGNNEFMVDPLTLFNIYTLRVQEIVTATIGKLGITQSGLDLLRSLIEERSLLGVRTSHGYMSKQGDQYIWREVTKDDIEADVRKLEEICAWASNHCVVLPAVGTDESPAVARKFAGMMDSAFTDCILAANGTGRVLLSDDQRLRLYAKQLWGVDGVWLQSVLLVAVDRNLMPFDLYSDVTASLVEAGFYFTTINHNVLLKLAENERWGASDRFKAVIATLGGEKVDVRSSLAVASNFLHHLWLEPLLIPKRENLTFALINAITNKCCRPEIKELLERLVLIGLNFPLMERRNYWITICKWCYGHFVPIPLWKP